MRRAMRRCGVWCAVRRWRWGTIARKCDCFLGEIMDGWKKALVLGSIGAAGILFMKKKYPAGVLATVLGWRCWRRNIRRSLSKCGGRCRIISSAECA